MHLARHMGENASTIRNARERCGGCTQKRCGRHDTLLVYTFGWIWDTKTINSTLSKWDYVYLVFWGRRHFAATPSCGFLIASIAGGNVEQPKLHDKSTGRAPPTTHHTTMFRFYSLGCGLGFRHKQILSTPTTF